MTSKNPKKVAAGQKGAAVRKAKQEALLKQLQKDKEGLRPSQTTPAQPAETAETTPAGAAAQSSWIAYAALAAVAVGAALYAQKSTPPGAARVKAAPVGTPGARSIGAEKKVQLNEKPDPFHMQ